MQDKPAERTGATDRQSLSRSEKRHDEAGCLRPDHGDASPASEKRPREIDGPAGPDPVRYGDWERGGRCIDF